MIARDAYVVAIPKEYVKWLDKDIKSRNVELFFLNSRAVMTLSPPEGYVKVMRIEAKGKTKEELIQSIYTAYIAGVDEVRISKVPELFELGIKKVAHTLSERNCRIEDDSITIIFENMYESSDELINRAYRECEGLFQEGQKLMIEYPKVPKWSDDVLSEQNAAEDRVDAMVIKAKRQLTQIMIRPGVILKDRKTKELEPILQHYLVLIELERLADKELAVSRQITIMKKNLGKPDDFFSRKIRIQKVKDTYSLIEYYKTVFSLVKSVWENRNEPKKMVEYSNIRHNWDKDRVGYLPEVLPIEWRSALINYINEVDCVDSFIRWRAHVIEQSIWSMTKCAENIAQHFGNILIECNDIDYLPTQPSRSSGPDNHR